MGGKGFGWLWRPEMSLKSLGGCGGPGVGLKSLRWD